MHPNCVCCVATGASCDWTLSGGVSRGGAGRPAGSPGMQPVLSVVEELSRPRREKVNVSVGRRRLVLGGISLARRHSTWQI